MAVTYRPGGGLLCIETCFHVQQLLSFYSCLMPPCFQWGFPPLPQAAFTPGARCQSAAKKFQYPPPSADQQYTYEAPAIDQYPRPPPCKYSRRVFLLAFPPP